MRLIKLISLVSSFSVAFAMSTCSSLVSRSYVAPSNGLVDIGAADVVEEGEESDDDVGPMPLPAGADGVPTKKRKGVYSLSVFSRP